MTSPGVLWGEEEGYPHVERFIDILETVRASHPDAEKVSYERLINYALEGMVGSLDQFSGFYHPESQFSQAETVTVDHLQIKSLGLTLGQNDQGVVVLAVHKGSPAAKAHIAEKDFLKAIGKQPVQNLSELPAALLQKAPGSQSLCSFFRKSTVKKWEVKLTHRAVLSKAITKSNLLPGSDIGYLYLSEFSASTHHEIENALDKLEDQGMKALILDLRQNPGGYLAESVKLLGEFLPPDTTVVTTRGRDRNQDLETLKTPSRRRVKRDYPLAVLIDQNSASASELVSGAFQDLKRATIIGEQSYGKGSVQNISPAPFGGTFRLTTATYHTPSGKTPHEIGITPDHLVEISSLDRDLFIQWLERENLSAEKQAQIDQWRDPVLEKAKQVLSP